MIIHNFRPWRLALDQVGPFRDVVEEIHFVGRDGDLANLFMLAAHNGKGKTTALESMVFLFSMLSESFEAQTWGSHPLLRDPKSRAQLDLFMTLSHEEQREVQYVISLSLGLEHSTQLFGGAAESVDSMTNGRAERRCRLGFVRDAWSGKLRPATLTHSVDGPDQTEEERQLQHAEAEAVKRALRAYVSAEAARIPFSDFSPDSLDDARPTLLYFTAHRDVVASAAQDLKLCEPEQPEYQPTHLFGADGQRWASSLSNLLVWYYWIEPRLYAKVRDYVNGLLFSDGNGKGLAEEPHKRPIGVDVSTLTGTHLLEHLSSGERNLVQFFVRLSAHATRHTIILIDELENHLHPKFQALLMQRIKDALRLKPNWSVIFTTHSRDTIGAFDAFTEERGICKGGELLEPGRF